MERHWKERSMKQGVEIPSHISTWEWFLLEFSETRKTRPSINKHHQNYLLSLFKSVGSISFRSVLLVLILVCIVAVLWRLVKWLCGTVKLFFRRRWAHGLHFISRLHSRRAIIGLCIDPSRQDNVPNRNNRTDFKRTMIKDRWQDKLSCNSLSTPWRICTTVELQSLPQASAQETRFSTQSFIDITKPQIKWLIQFSSSNAVIRWIVSGRGLTSPVPFELRIRAKRMRFKNVWRQPVFVLHPSGSKLTT